MQRSHNLGKFPQIFAVSMGVVLGIMRILCIPFKILLFGNCSANSQPPSPSRNNDMEISCESAVLMPNAKYKWLMLLMPKFEIQMTFSRKRFANTNK